MIAVPPQPNHTKTSNPDSGSFHPVQHLAEAPRSNGHTPSLEAGNLVNGRGLGSSDASDCRQRSW